MAMLVIHRSAPNPSPGRRIAAAQRRNNQSNVKRCATGYKERGKQHDKARKVVQTRAYQHRKRQYPARQSELAGSNFRPALRAVVSTKKP